nr:unnamed protein product [Digitaria exilis]
MATVLSNLRVPVCFSVHLVPAPAPATIVSMLAKVGLRRRAVHLGHLYNVNLITPEGEAELQVPDDDGWCYARLLRLSGLPGRDGCVCVSGDGIDDDRLLCFIQTRCEAPPGEKHRNPRGGPCVCERIFIQTGGGKRVRCAWVSGPWPFDWALQPYHAAMHGTTPCPPGATSRDEQAELVCADSPCGPGTPRQFDMGLTTSAGQLLMLHRADSTCSYRPDVEVRDAITVVADICVMPVAASIRAAAGLACVDALNRLLFDEMAPRPQSGCSYMQDRFTRAYVTRPSPSAQVYKVGSMSPSVHLCHVGSSVAGTLGRVSKLGARSPGAHQLYLGAKGPCAHPWAHKPPPALSSSPLLSSPHFLYREAPGAAGPSCRLPQGSKKKVTDFLDYHRERIEWWNRMDDNYRLRTAWTRDDYAEILRLVSVVGLGPGMFTYRTTFTRQRQGAPHREKDDSNSDEEEEQGHEEDEEEEEHDLPDYDELGSSQFSRAPPATQPSQRPTRSRRPPPRHTPGTDALRKRRSK